MNNDGDSGSGGRDNGRDNGRDSRYEKNERKKTVAEEIDDLLDDCPDFDFYELPEEDFVMKRGFLRKGEGKLASHRHGPTQFSMKRKESFTMDQNKQEIAHHQHNKKISREKLTSENKFFCDEFCEDGLDFSEKRHNKTSHF